MSKEEEEIGMMGACVIQTNDELVIITIHCQHHFIMHTRFHHAAWFRSIGKASLPSTISCEGSTIYAIRWGSGTRDLGMWERKDTKRQCANLVVVGAW
jgi:hypothetical protein